MNPLSLFAKGRTFKDMTPQPSAYKVLADSGLPKSIGGTVRKVEQSPTSPTSSAGEEKAPVIPPAPAAASASSARPQLWKGISLFCRRLVQRFILGRKGRSVERKSVQTELALDKVTVLRNDLNEDDLEVVLVKRKVGTGEKPLARLSKMEMTGEAWNRLTAPFRKKNSESAINPKAEAKEEAPELSARV